MNIKSYREVKFAYEMINIFTEADNKTPTEGVKNLIAQYKRNCREFYKSQRDYFEMESRVIKQNNYGSVTILTKFPSYIKSMEEAEEYFKEYLYKKCYYTPYDCSGQIFTVWYSIFKRNNEYIVYHCEAMDI